MLEYIFAGLLLAAVYLLHSWLIRPRREITRYTRLFRSYGYKVVQLPYNPLGAPFYDGIVEDNEKKKDPFYTHKHVYASTDIMVANVLNKPDIVVMNA